MTENLVEENRSSPREEFHHDSQKSAAAAAVDDEEANIVKAVRFWKHPSLRDIPMEQKRHYLHEQGVTDAQIYKAWDRILADDTVLPAPQNNLPSTTTTATNMAPTSTFPPPPPQYAGQSPAPFYSNPTSLYASSPPPDAYRIPYSLPPRYDEEEGPGPFLQGVSLVALGGLVGLTAAAAARWLNGGEFHLLPPPSVTDDTKQSKNVVLGNRHANRNGSYEEEEDDDEENGQDHLVPTTVDEEYVTDDDHDVDDHGLIPEPQEDKLLEQVQAISESFKSHVAIQEKILQKLSSSGSTITNQSMDLLRKASGVTTTNEDSSALNSSSDILKIWSQLLDIKGQLINLQGLKKSPIHVADEKDEELANHLSSTLSKLDACLDSIQKASLLAPINSVDGPSATPLIIASETPVTPLKPVLVPDTNSPTRPLSLRQAIQKIAEENDATTLRVGTQLLYLYIINLTGASTNSRYRKIFTTNESFQKVESMKGGKDLLLAVGFDEEQPGCLEWLGSHPPSEEAEQLAMVKLQQAAKALGILKSGNPSSDLTHRALGVLTPEPDENPQEVVVVEAPLLPPSTPDESCLVSPPQPKKMPFVHLANETNPLPQEAESTGTTTTSDMGHET